MLYPLLLVTLTASGLKVALGKRREGGREDDQNKGEKGEREREKEEQEK